MKRSVSIAKQSCNPEGILGRINAFFMSFETRKINEIGLELLELQPDDKVLEIGFGHGKTISKGCKFLETGIFAGIDISETMLHVAEKRNREMIKKGKVDLKIAGADSIPYEEDYFNKVITVHTLYFWKNPLKSFKEINRVMKTGAMLVVGFKYDAKAIKTFPSEVFTFFSEDEVVELLKKANFSIYQIKKDFNSKRSLFLIAAKKESDNAVQ